MEKPRWEELDKLTEQYRAVVRKIYLEGSGLLGESKKPKEEGFRRLEAGLLMNHLDEIETRFGTYPLSRQRRVEEAKPPCRSLPCLT